jgi:two-component system phosphate regulon sensor histidine kinase PhoR
MVYSIHFQEKVFENCVNLALNKTIALLNQDLQVCSAMRQCMGCDGSRTENGLLNQNIWEQIHNSIDAELAMYDINLDYTLFITTNHGDTIRNGPVDLIIKQGTCYTQSLRELLQTSGYELVVSFPDRTRFFLNQAGVMLISSVFLILAILYLFIRMVGMYRNEVRLSENIRELINNISHEFRTPVASIALASNMIRKGLSDETKNREYGDLIYGETQKLQRQVDGLLDLAAMEWEEFEFQKKNWDIHEIIHEAISSVRMLVNEKSANIETEFSDDSAIISVDRPHMVNAVANLLTNALKYSNRYPEIRIRTFSVGENVGLEIRDNGIGIAAKYHKSIFEKYFRVPTGDVHNIKGFGIGLSYVKHVVEGHGGRIQVESEPGKGSTFVILLPKSD